MNIKSRILKLREEINAANVAYHTKDSPVISDFVYDRLIKELIELEEKHPEFDDANSPSKKIGGSILEGFVKHTHRVPMMSLSNCFTIDEVEAFFNRVKKVNENVSYITELKIDGLAVSLTYENGLFIRAATRGNGLVGEDITNNVKTIKNLPLKLKENIDIEVRGEIYMSHFAFKKTNEERLDKNLELFVNPRNAAAGTIRQLDSKVVAKRELSIFVYNIVEAIDYVKTQKEALEYLEKLGFPVNDNYHLTRTIEDISIAINKFDEIRRGLPYDTDGVVIKVNELNLYDEIGYTARSPKYQTAFKFEAEKAESIIKGITFQVGRTGVITPVAELEPVFISGSLVSRATLHNEDYILGKDIRVNDHVMVHKAGEIIPEVINVIMEKRKNQIPFKMIDKCPVCGFDLLRKEGESDYYCQNPDCPGKSINTLIHFASRVAMDIDTLGIKVVELLHDLTYLQSITDIYKLANYKMELMELPGFGEKRVTKLLSAIEDSKQQTFDRFIFGLGIKHIGAKVAKTLVNHYHDIDNLMKANYEELIEIRDIGEQIALSVINYFNDPYNITMIEELKSFGINMKQEKVETKEHEFNGKTFVLTGSLPTLTREEAAKIIEAHGGKTSSSVSKKTDYILAGNDAGSKLRKAQELGINILNEEEFRLKINE